MKNIPVNLQEKLNGGSTSLCMCWELTLTDSTVMRYTDCSTDVLVSGNTFKSAASVQRTAIAMSLGLGADNVEVQGALTSDEITEADLLSGRYDYARVHVFILDFLDPGAGSVSLLQGFLGEVSLNQYDFRTQVYGRTWILGSREGESTTPSCRATLGDSRCKFSLASMTYAGTVQTVTSRLAFTGSHNGSLAAAWLNYGTVTWITGANAGRSMEVKAHAGASIELVLPMTGVIAIGDTYSVTAGCDKVKSTCVSKFNNIANFVGEPDIPGVDYALNPS